MNSLLRKTIAAKAAPTVLVIFSVAILTWASLRAYAAWHFFAAQTVTEHMHEADAFAPGDMAYAVECLDKALARSPGNPDYLDLAGHLKELQAGQTGVVGRERNQLLESAADDYRRALAARPLWPYSWASLLAVKDKLGQVDEEFNRAMERAAETGPWEPRVQLQVIRSGVRYWDRLGTEEQELVRQKATDALKVQPREVFRIARSYGRPDLVCEPRGLHSQIDRWCEDVM